MDNKKITYTFYNEHDNTVATSPISIDLEPGAFGK
jgi:hypothetical protein